MVLSTDPLDKTWQIHLNALRVLLHQCSNGREGSSPQSDFQRFSSQNGRETVSPSSLSSFDKASLLLDIAKLALKRLNDEFNELFGNISPPRKLDVQKLRRSIKEVHDNLLLVPSMFGSEYSTASQGDTPASLRLLVHNTLILITSTLLLKIATFLERSSSSRTPKTPSLLELNRLIQQQVRGIYLSASSLISTIRNSTSYTSEHCLRRPGAWRGTYSQILGLIWPLYSASQLSDNAAWRECTRESLWNIGVYENIPIALSMVSLC